ncbi:MAG TPA: hypothetical protein VID31_18840 [Streptosporangiaceae bacterium]
MLWPCPKVKVKPRPGRIFPEQYLPEHADGPAGAVRTGRAVV